MANENEITRELLDAGSGMAGYSRLAPYKVPAGYFESLPDLILWRVRTEMLESSSEEISAISPLLAGLNKKQPFSVPEGYFENIPTAPAAKRPGKVISLSGKSIFKYAAAAVLTGIIAITAWFYAGNNGKTEQVLAGVSDTSAEFRSLEAVSELEMAAFVEAGGALYLDQAPVAGELAENDVQWLLSDVSDRELEQYLKQNTLPVEKYN